MVRIFLLGCWLVLGGVSHLWAGEPARMQEVLAGSTIKTLARAFIAAADLEAVKSNSIGKLNRMGPETYRKQYAKQYRVMKDLPDKLKKKYGIVENMPREKMIRFLRSLDKKQVYVLVEAIPNATIAREVGGYFQTDDASVQGKSFLERVQMVWQDIVLDMTRKPAGP